MFNFSKRLTSQGITWEQLLFQFVIVVLGVYLAIAFERRAEEQNRQEDAREMLGRVLEELRLDEAEFNQIIAGADLICPAFDSLSVLMNDRPNEHGDQIYDLLYGPLFSFWTVFPRRAAYTAMISGGYLTAVPDQGLTVRLADLYEHGYARVVTNGEMVDRFSIESYVPFMNDWDIDRRVFLDPGPAGTAAARNAMRTMRDMYCTYYTGSLLPDMLDEVIGVRTELEAYLGPG